MAILCVGVYGLFRAGELVKNNKRPGLCRAGVTWHQQEVIIHLSESKTDVFRHGADIVLYKNNTKTCPYTHFKGVWESAKNKNADAAAFQNSDGSPVTYDQLLKAIKALMKQLGYKVDQVGTHSMRIGGASTLAILGVPAHIIKILGRWLSLTYQVYTRTSNEHIQRVQALIGAEGLKTKDNAFGGLSLSAATMSSIDDLEVKFGF